MTQNKRFRSGETESGKRNNRAAGLSGPEKTKKDIRCFHREGQTLPPPGDQAESARQQKTKNESQRIVEQAMQMFVTQGIKAVRMDDIAQQLGVSKRTLYELFGDKEGLLYLAMECYFNRNRASQNELCADAPNVLEAMFMVLDSVMDNAEVTNRMLNNLRKFYPSVYGKVMREGAEKSRSDLREMLETGIREGLFIDTFDIELSISVLYHTATALVSRKELILPEGMTEREAFVQIVRNFFRGISTAQGMQLIDDYQRRSESGNKEKLI